MGCGNSKSIDVIDNNQKKKFRSEWNSKKYKWKQCPTKSYHSN